MVRCNSSLCGILIFGWLSRRSASALVPAFCAPAMMKSNFSVGSRLNLKSTGTRLLKWFAPSRKRRPCQGAGAGWWTCWQEKSGNNPIRKMSSTDEHVHVNLLHAASREKISADHERDSAKLGTDSRQRRVVEPG